MKSTLIRIFVVMTLATSISAFAGTKKDHTAKTNCDSGNTEGTSTPSPQAADKTNRNEAQSEQSDQDQEKSRRQRLIEEQNKQWLHDVQYLGS
jgi:hypothetical protein